MATRTVVAAVGLRLPRTVIPPLAVATNGVHELYGRPHVPAQREGLRECRSECWSCAKLPRWPH